MLKPDLFRKAEPAGEGGEARRDPEGIILCTLFHPGNPCLPHLQRQSSHSGLPEPWPGRALVPHPSLPAKAGYEAGPVRAAERARTLIR